jgi:hypothetical protein
MRGTRHKPTAPPGHPSLVGHGTVPQEHRDEQIIDPGSNDLQRGNGRNATFTLKRGPGRYTRCVQDMKSCMESMDGQTKAEFNMVGGAPTRWTQVSGPLCIPTTPKAGSFSPRPNGMKNRPLTVAGLKAWPALQPRSKREKKSFGNRRLEGDQNGRQDQHTTKAGSQHQQWRQKCSRWHS